MTTILKNALKRVENLPCEDQDAIGQLILDILDDETQWEKLFADPRSDRFLEEMEKYAAGEEKSVRMRSREDFIKRFR